ncbi:ArnT family glycosyltransferase [Roseospira marina]|nr:glycosyltransferase family 39 protein [Roseospira marina]MBB4313619.1 4-amino-4-deoxy-L-arabinose transferase-like glycosyltransferase [Roseospira marina]MBB5086781.1 4-amino-4-deoxy-L-arabinose transferase-like glycosyltransferase [Roseospira marina]
MSSTAAPSVTTGMPGRTHAFWRWLDPGDPARATLILILVTAVIRLGLAVLMDFGNGESYYLAGTRVPHLSYFDQPPLALWLGWAMLALTGSDDPAIIRLPFIVLFAGTTWMLFTLTRRLYSPRAGFYAALLLNVSAVFTVSVGGWFQPDGPLMLFWLVTAWALVRVMLPEPGTMGPARIWGWWLFIGISLGLTVLSKYHAAFLIAGAGLFALTRRDQWRWVSHPAPYVAMLVAFVVASPVLIWNLQNDWVSFAFQGGRSVESAGLRPEWLLRSVLGQMTWLLPWVWLPMIWVFARALIAGPSAREDWFLACVALGPIAFFTIVALWAPLGFHFHWQAPGYLMLFPLLGRFAANGVTQRPRLTRGWLGTSVTVTTVVIAVLASHIATNWIAHVMPLEKDPTLEALEWRDQRDDLRARGLLGQPRTFAAATHWVEGGKVDSAVGGAMPVVVLSDDPRNLAFTLDLTTVEGWDVLMMGTDHRLKDPAARFSQTIRGGVELVDRFDLTRGGDVVLRDVGVFLAHNFSVRHRIEFDGTDPDSYFGEGWGAFEGGPGARAIDAEAATLHFDIEPRVRYGHLVLRARSSGGQQTLRVAWEGQPVGRLVLPEDGSAVDLVVPVPGDRRVGRWQGTLTLTPERPGVTVERVTLDPVSSPHPTGAGR